MRRSLLCGDQGTDLPRRGGSRNKGPEAGKEQADLGPYVRVPDELPRHFQTPGPHPSFSMAPMVNRGGTRLFSSFVQMGKLKLKEKIMTCSDRYWQ